MLAEEVSAQKNDLSAYADGTKVVAKATTADSATKATQDANGKDIAHTYATILNLNATNEAIADIKNGNTKVASASEADKALKADSATLAEVAIKDRNGNVILDTYATKTEIADMFKPKLVHIKADKELGTIDNTANCVYGRICVLSFRFVAKVDIPSGTFMHSSYITYGDTDKVLRPLIKSYLIANKYNADNSLGESMTFSVESVTFSDEGVTGGVIRPIQDIPAGTTLYITGTFVIRDENTIT